MEARRMTRYPRPKLELSPAQLSIAGLPVVMVAWLNAEARAAGKTASAVAKGILIDCIGDEIERERQCGRRSVHR